VRRIIRILVIENEQDSEALPGMTVGEGGCDFPLFDVDRFRPDHYCERDFMLWGHRWLTDGNRQINNAALPEQPAARHLRLRC